GNGKGSFGQKTALHRNWGTKYNAIVGLGDLTGDGRPDLAARDTSGRIWRLNSTTNGTFTKAVQLGTGWQVYTGIH
ncbi:hypothetical protein ABTZ17_34020, partial [Streptomyces sp. NPDC097619]